MAPFSDNEINTLEMTATFSRQSDSLVSNTLRTFVDSVSTLRESVPDVVPETLSDGGPPMAEFDAGIVFKTSA